METSAEARHGREQYDSYKKAESDHSVQLNQTWKERMLRVEEPDIKTKEQKEAEAKAHHEECLKAFNQMAHDNPEWHLRFLYKELEWETFCLVNKLPYVPGWGNGVPGYWDYRKKHAEHWILKTRERLPDE